MSAITLQPVSIAIEADQKDFQVLQFSLFINLYYRQFFSSKKTPQLLLPFPNFSSTLSSTSLESTPPPAAQTLTTVS